MIFRRFLLLCFAFGLPAAFLPGSFGQADRLPLRISISPMPVSAPMLLARDLGWFTRAGLNVELIEYSLGKIALEDMSTGKLDLAGAAVTPLVYRCLAGADFRILATIASSTGLVAVVARKDAGISHISDLAGKRVGVPKGTSGEYFFDTLRVLHRVPRTSLQTLDLSLDEMVAGIRNGSLDAASLWETQLSELGRAMPDRLTLFYGNGLYTFSWNLVALPSTIVQRRAEIEKLLRVLNDAADFIEREPQAAKQQLATLGQHGQDIAHALAEANYRPMLRQELLVQLEAETRWVLARDGKRQAVPNYLRFLSSSPLETVNPAAVRIIK